MILQGDKMEENKVHYRIFKISEIEGARIRFGYQNESGGNFSFIIFESHRTPSKLADYLKGIDNDVHDISFGLPLKTEGDFLQVDSEREVKNFSELLEIAQECTPAEINEFWQRLKQKIFKKQKLATQKAS